MFQASALTGFARGPYHPMARHQMIGQTVTHYRIIEQVGEGGMGVVYRAEDTRLGRQVAVKFLSPKLLQDPQAVERFQREARAVSSLNHPNICSLYDVGSHEGHPFLVMELLDGATLRRRISGRALALDAILDISIQIADALDFAHARGILHRDIKTGNIFVTERGQVKILDFGLAKMAEVRSAESDPYAVTMLRPQASPATETGQAMGTLTCMSPEQARGEDLDHRSDLFSMGIVLYEMATGREPFGGKTPALIFDAILRHVPPRPSELNTHLPAELDHIVAKALEKDRETRYQTAAEMRADLRRLKRDSDSVRTTMARQAAATGAILSPEASTAVAPTPPPTALAATPASVTPAGATPASATTVLAPSMPSGPATAPTVGVGGRITTRTLALVAAAVLALTGAVAIYLMRGSATTIDSVAVLPVVSQEASADTEYLTDGITETLINGLAQLPNLRVSARSVVFRYKNKDADPQEVGRALNVAAVVTGRIAARGDRIIIQTELMRVDDGTQLWGDQYDRTKADLLTVQEEIADEILDKVQPRLSGEERRRATRQYTANADAYQIYLQGRYHWNKGTIEGYKRAIDYFQQAITMDPKYALAYTGLADSYLLLGSYLVEVLPQAKEAAEQALAIDPTLAEAHVARGHIQAYLDWDWAGAEREFQQAISLNPSLALAHNQYANYLATVGRVPDALSEVRRAQELDPLSPIVNADMGWYLLYAGRTSEAMAQFRKTLEFDPNSVSASRGLGVALSEEGQHAAATAELTRAVTLSDNSPVVLGNLGAAYARAKDTANTARVLRELTSMSERAYVPSTALAAIYAAQGDRPRALDALDKAFDEHDFGIAQLNVAPWFGALRGEPRFQALLKKLKLAN